MALTEDKIKRIEFVIKENRRPSVPDKVWHEMFNEYNQDNKTNLHLKCSVCYLKVARYLIDKHLKNKHGI